MLRADDRENALWRHRNLGKAFYENPTTQVRAVEEFRKALELAPDSVRERINYGLALLRAGKTEEGVAELEKAQTQDPSIPHTWFNLGIVFKRQGEFEQAIRQLQRMVQLRPGEPASHFNLGLLYKMTGKAEKAMKEFEESARLNPDFAGPHYQLGQSYRQARRAEEASRELKLFETLRKKHEGAAVPENLEWSYYSEVYEPIDTKRSPPDSGRIVPAKFRERQVPGSFSGLAVFDADADRYPDLLAWSDRGLLLLKNGVTPVDNSGLAGMSGVVAVAPGDFDNDGLADLCVVAKQGAMLYRNMHGVFRHAPAQLPAGLFSAAVWLDYDHDYDVDLFLLGSNSVLMRNNGRAGFSDRTADFPFVSGRALDAIPFHLVSDFDGKDLLVSYAGRTGVLYRDQLGGKYDVIPLRGLPAGTRSLAAADFNNDGWIDLAAADRGIMLFENRSGNLDKVSAKYPGGCVAFADVNSRGVQDLIASGTLVRNTGWGEFRDGQDLLAGAGTAAVATDFNSDGRMDLALVTAEGALRILFNETTDGNHWIAVGLTGVKNLKLASGAIVEVKSGPLYQKQPYEGVPLVFGLRAYRDVDTVRITWPNGLIQNETGQPADKVLEVKELPRLSGSCPMIFAWNGNHFEFITDVLGVAPLGASAGDGHYFPVDHDEYVQIAGESLAPRDGRYEIRITEELREVTYLDQVKLIAVDHSARTEIFTNDKFKSPPFPQFRLFGADRRVYPKSARDGLGREVTARILRRDHVYVDNFRHNSSGVAELHVLDLDFGHAAPDGKAVLILNGWVDWADGSTYLGTAQESKDGLVLPYLQVKDEAGRWRSVIDDMGIPAGKPKTIAVDLSGKFLSKSREVRIVTNLCLYWDEIFLSERTEEPATRRTGILAESAELRFRGFSKVTIDPERRQPERFDYAQQSPVSMWNPTKGRYTRFGDVRPLLEAVDDRFVIMGSGDELRLLFFEVNLPPLPAGWRRDFLLLVDGWAKDGDANTAFSQTVEPLPFHAMSEYPYPETETYPRDEIHRKYIEQYITRPALRLIHPLVRSAEP